MADVRTFRAATMRDAFDRVREELGADAVILHTRQVSRRRFLPWRAPIQEVEITASLTLEVGAKDARTARRAATRAEETVAAPSRKAKSPAPRHVPQTGGLDLVSEPTGPIAEMLRPLPPPDSADASRSGRFGKGHGTRSVPAPSADSRFNRFTGHPIGWQSRETHEPDPTAALARRLDSIQQMLHDLGRSNFASRREELPSELFDLYTDLIDADVHEDDARDLILKLRLSAKPGAPLDATSARALITALVESEIRCCEPITPKPGRRRVVALVGPTGVGKTTTIAKLAANFRLRGGIKMGLVTVDTYRVAAVEQLRTYAEIIDLPMTIVTNPLEMRRALEQLTGLDLVLIDTAGRSPKDDLQIAELKSLLTEAKVDEVHLVLSMTSSLRSLEACAATFAAAGTTAAILTKLDEASGMGALLSVTRRANLPISYLTVGQNVPDDIEPAHPRRIARLILGQERLVK